MMTRKQMDAFKKYARQSADGHIALSKALAGALNDTFGRSPAAVALPEAKCEAERLKQRFRDSEQ